MKNILYLAALAFLSACGGETEITVSNPLPVGREGEIAEVEAAQIVKKYPDGFVIADSADNEIPYQLTYDGKLIFPVNIGPSRTLRLFVRKGIAKKVEPRVYGRVFPEHKDNMNWENEKAAYVAYGPALQAAGEKGYGYDIWTKSVDSLVLEDRYRLDAGGKSMHKDNGNGMDAYIVASTLGGGTAALLDSKGEIVYPWAWRTAQVLDNGPLRFTVRLVYNPAIVENDSNVVETRLITLDSGSHLNRAEIRYEGLSVPRKVAAGIVVHQQNPEGYSSDAKHGWIAYRDSTEDTKNDNGVIYLGAYVPGGKSEMKYQPISFETRDALGHILSVSDYDAEKGFVYYFGSGWSKGAMPENWERYLSDFGLRNSNPLKVIIR